MSRTEFTNFEIVFMHDGLSSESLINFLASRKGSRFANSVAIKELNIRKITMTPSELMHLQSLKLLLA